MYDNIGGKIKLLAGISFIITALGAIITGFVLFNTYEELWCFLIMVLGITVALASSWLIYGFGELIDNTAMTNNLLKTTANKANEQRAAQMTTRPLATNEWRCSCGQISPKYITSCRCGKSQIDVLAEQNNNQSL